MHMGVHTLVAGVNSVWAYRSYLPGLPKCRSYFDIPAKQSVPRSNLPILQSSPSNTRATHTHIHTMSNNARYYYSLPTEAPKRSRSGSRRPPLTPSVVSSPCLTTHVPVASRRGSSSSSGSPTKASVLLAKVASSPTTPRGETPLSSPMPSPEMRHSEMHSTSPYASERPVMWRSESERYVRQYRQQGELSVC